MSVRFISLCSHDQLVFFFDTRADKVKAVPFPEALGTARYANNLPNKVITSLCYQVTSNRKVRQAS